ncbi:MAG: hypothetical protein Q4P30_05290 [Eubacteriales bacterium]|nr:hypothetical protein [Eubacteriales bacterium]
MVKIIGVVCACIALVGLGILVSIKIKTTDNDLYHAKAYKPMLKVNERIYYEEDTLQNIDMEKLEKIGEIKNSYNSGTKKVTMEDENGTSNVYPKGSQIYRNGEKIIVVQGANIWLLKELED